MNRLLTDESTRDSSRLDYLHQQFIKPFWDSIEPTVSSLMAAGRIPRVPAHICTSPSRAPHSPWPRTR
ncbi:hypothetical protein E4K10_44400 [Streptomyces sp. T1317-0309]|nr:hypothetical protein E4K10_44400 [Streptomyces sp. T1317-0309]